MRRDESALASVGRRAEETWSLQALRPTNWSLRTRLTMTLVGLLAIGLLITGATAQRLVAGYVNEQIDAQLRSLSAGQLSPSSIEDALNPTSQVGIPEGVVVMVLGADASTVAVLRNAVGEIYPEPEIRTQRGRIVTAPEGSVLKLRAESGDGWYRAVVQKRVGLSGYTLIAIHQSSASRMLELLRTVGLSVALIVLLLLLLIGRYVVKIALRPVFTVEEVATEITNGNLTRRLPVRGSGDEVEHIAIALNTMLDRIQELFAQRDASDERLRRFVADASHELRTPLTVIQGFAELHRRNSGQDENIERIETEARRMAALVDDLLLLARLDQQRELEYELVDLGAVLDDVMEAAGVVSGDHIVVYEQARRPYLVDGDEVRLHQALSNLLSNARVHTPAGTTIRASIEEHDQHVRVCVCDNGPGISLEHREAAFERFWQQDPSRSARGSSGLGLAIVASVVAAHHGKVRCEETGDGGACFIVEIPTAKDPEGLDGDVAGLTEQGGTAPLLN